MCLASDVLYHCIAPEQWSNEGVLELRTAFSRDQSHKIYVQDIIVEDAKLLWNLLQVIMIHVHFVPL